jgi:hypothetical protein
MEHGDTRRNTQSRPDANFNSIFAASLWVQVPPPAVQEESARLAGANSTWLPLQWTAPALATSLRSNSRQRVTLVANERSKRLPLVTSP